MFRRAIILLLPLLAACVFSAAHSAQAQDAPPVNAKAQALGPLAGKLDARLIPAVNALRAGATKDAGAALAIKSVHGRALASTAKAEQLAVRLDAPVTGALLAQIRATGAVVTHSAPQWNNICVNATVSQIDALAKIDPIRGINLQAGRRLFLKNTTPNQGDTAMHADAVRASYGVSGLNQRVGVISDSVIDTAAVRGASISITGTAPYIIVSSTVPQGTGDLPAFFQIIDPGPGGGTDEGEAMMELIHDVAPNAYLVFADAENDQAAMASNLLALRTTGNCTITVDDAAFWDEPFFQDGPIAQAIRTNYNAGVPHFSAFGNDGTQGVLATYTPINSTVDDGQYNPPSGNCFHNWNIATSTPSFLPISLPKNDELTVVLQWNQPFQSYNLGNGSQADLDLYLYATNAIGAVLANCENNQGTSSSPSGDPVEIIHYFNNTGSDTTVYLTVNHYQGVRNNIMRLLFVDTLGTFSFPAGGVAGMTAYGHRTSQECISVGAMYWKDIRDGKLTPETSSSAGGIGANGIPYYFDTSGNPLPGAPVLRSAPDIVAPDGCTTSVFPSSKIYSGFPEFYGTSCAAPNAAAVAALLLEAAPGTSPAALAAVLKTTANKATNPAAPNAIAGNGLIDAQAAFQALIPAPVFTSSTTATGNVGSPFSYKLAATGFGTITYSATNLPAGLAFSGNTISGTPTAQGTFNNVALSATNIMGTANQTLTITIGAPIPVQITVQPAATPNPAATGASVTFTVYAAGGSGQTLVYSWDFGDNSTGSGNSVAHAYNSAGVYTATVVVSESVGTPASATVDVAVIAPLVFTSPPSATPNPAGLGQTVSFSAAAAGGSGTLAYTWTFGDGGTGTGASTTHVYATALSFTATVTATDIAGVQVSATVTVAVNAPLVGTGVDTNGNGISDSFEAATGFDPGQPITAAALQSLSVSKTSIKLNFAHIAGDSIAFSGTLPIPSGFSAAGQKVICDVGGIISSFTLNAKGLAKNASNAFKLQFKSKKGAVAAQTAQYTFQFTKGNFEQTLASSGMTDTNQQGANVSVLVTILFNGDLYQATKSLSYTSSFGKGGIAR